MMLTPSPPDPPVCRDHHVRLARPLDDPVLTLQPLPHWATVLAVLLFLAMLVAPCSVRAETTHRVYLKGTESELDVYFIKGRLPGPTLLIVGGIQGDEPGGYLAADLYAEIALKKGNLIVVPRANFFSIVNDTRGANGDMNRKFAGGNGQADRDVRVVETIKDLMDRSDFFLNLHDGSGFYSPVWESPERNPARYGQSIIADSEQYTAADGQVMELGRIARRVVEKINSQVSDQRHFFRFNNHRTLDPNTRHKEQRLSATYYGLTKAGIPAFAIETSKNIPDYHTRVTYQTMAINAFMDEFGIVRENPKIYLDQPVLKYMIVSVNDRAPMVVSGHDLLKVHRGDRLRIVHIESNYSRGLTAQIKGADRKLNHLNRDIAATDDMEIEVRKDRFLIASIPVEIIRNRSAGGPGGVHVEPRVSYFCVRVNDRTYVVEPGEELTVMRGDKLTLLDPKTNLDGESEKTMRVDLRGFQAESSPYPVEDRGHVIDTDKDLQAKYGTPRGDLTVYALQAKLNNRVFGQSFIAVARPKLEYLVLRGSVGAGFVVRAEDRLEVPADEVIRIVDVRTNLPASTTLFVTMAGRTIRWDPTTLPGIDASKLSDQGTPLDITREGRSIGRIWVKHGTEFRLSTGDKPSEPAVPVRY